MLIKHQQGNRSTAVQAILGLAMVLFGGTIVTDTNLIAGWFTKAFSTSFDAQFIYGSAMICGGLYGMIYGGSVLYPLFSAPFLFYTLQSIFYSILESHTYSAAISNGALFFIASVEIFRDNYYAKRVTFSIRRRTGGNYPPS